MASESKWNSKFNPKKQLSTANWNTNSIPGTDNSIMEQQYIKDMNNAGNRCAVSIALQNQTSLPNVEKTSGIMLIRLHDTLGPNNNDETSPMNMAFIEHKAYMDTALGQQFGYSAADLGQVIGAYKSVVDIYRVIRRILSLPNNPKTPISNYSIAGLLKAMRLSTEDVYDPNPLKVQREIACRRRNYIDDVNNTLDLFDELGVPKKLANLFDVSSDYYDKVYLDATSQNAQFYMFYPAGWYNYDETIDPAGAVLTYKTFYNDLNTPKASSNPSDPNYSPNAGNHTCSVQDLIDLFNQMVMDLTQFTDSKAILHKLFNAYGTANLYEIPEIGYDEKVPYVFDAGFRNTIRNLAWFQDIQYAKYTVDPNREIVMGRPVLRVNSGAAPGALAGLINLPLQFSDAPSKITDKNIADALVLHPVMGYVRRYAVSSGYELEFDFGNQMGFAIPVEVVLVGPTTVSGVYDQFSFRSKPSRYGSFDAAFLDWSFYPPIVDMSAMIASDCSTVSVYLNKYYQERETEATVSRADLQYWFRAFALGVYATTDRMETKGQRAIVG